MNLTFLKKYFGWKTLALLGLFALAACTTSSVGTSGALDCTLILLFVVIASFYIVFAGNHGMAPALEAADMPPSPSTNAAVFSINWSKQTDANQQGGNYQLSLPFADYS